jgi:membrane-anchored glycerophosphoryl diester phosphodiesterase (GDPDase)
VSPARALAEVLGRWSALVLPTILIALGYIAVTIPLTLNAQNIQSAELAAAARGGTGNTNWLTFLGIVVSVALFYLSVRWAVAVPAILAERIGLRGGLRRSSQLTRGFRLRLAGVFLIVGLLQVLTVGLPSLVIGLVVGFSASSAWAGVVAFALTAVIGGALFAPIGAAIAAVAYGQLTERAAAAAPPG